MIPGCLGHPVRAARGTIAQRNGHLGADAPEWVLLIANLIEGIAKPGARGVVAVVAHQIQLRKQLVLLETNHITLLLEVQFRLQQVRPHVQAFLPAFLQIESFGHRHQNCGWPDRGIFPFGIIVTEQAFKDAFLGILSPDGCQ